MTTKRQKVKEALTGFGSRLVRRKHIAKGDLSTQLRRCLNTFDLCMLGIGQMVGAGIFVTTGEVMRKLAGPATIISYLISGIAALLSALCYAEFGARYPKAGSAYTYAYVGVGEIWAFIIGWNIVLEHCLSAAAVARTFAGYFDDLFHNVISGWSTKNIPWFPVHVPNITETPTGICVESGTEIEYLQELSIVARYPDVISVAIVLICAIFIGIGSKTTSYCNMVFQIANLLVILSVVGYGFVFADFGNWNNFAPCGVNGILSGASKCFFAYIGFDGLATAGEEAKNPSKMIPVATYWAMGITTAVYILMATVLSLMQPYYALSPTSVYAAAFTAAGAPQWVGTVITIGALLGILTSLIGCLFALPRAVYAMAEDGLVFSWWGKTPLNAIITYTLLTAVIAMLFDMDALVDFLSIGTILAYSIVAASLIVLRYRPHPQDDHPGLMDRGGQIRSNIPYLSKWLNGMNPGNTILCSLLVMIVAMTVIGILLTSSYYKTVLGGILFALSIAIAIAATVFIHFHHENDTEMDYKVALVPYLPALSLLVNILMVTQLTVMTWVRFAVWLTIGLTIYFFYGIKHSKEEQNWKEQQKVQQNSVVTENCTENWAKNSAEEPNPWIDVVPNDDAVVFSFNGNGATVVPAFKNGRIRL